jgi:asparagine synthase (glutamine-hydrolysing)
MAPVEAIERVPRLFGQPFADSSAVPTYFVAKAARESRKVVLNGDGGDEVFAGYRRYWAGRAAPLSARLDPRLRGALAAAGLRLARGRRRRSALGFVGRTLRGFAQEDGERYLSWTNDLLGELDLRRCFPDLVGSESTLDRLARLGGERPSSHGLRAFQRSDYRLTLPDQLLVKMDIATMANSLEARSPFLDVSLVELAWSLPVSWLLSPRVTKPLLRSLASDVLTPDIVSAPKRGFEVPVARWLAEDLRSPTEDLLLGSDSRVAELGDRPAVRSFVLGKDAFEGNRPQAVWAMLMLEIFLRGGT